MKNELGTLKGLPILSCWIVGEEQGDMMQVFSYREAYNKIKELKQSDKKENIDDVYTLTLETEEGYYYGFKVKKYRNKLKVTR